MTIIERLHSLPLDCTECYQLAHDILMNPDLPMTTRIDALAVLDRAIGGVPLPIGACSVNEYVALHQ